MQLDASSLLRTLVFTLTLLTTSATPGASSARFYRLSYMDDHIIFTPGGNLEDTTVAQRFNVTSSSQCAAECLTMERCSSFFYHRGDGLCLMHSVLFLGKDEASLKNGTTYWQLTQDDCPSGEGFVLYRALGLCYKYHDQLVYWDTAESTCNAAGTSLLKVDTPDKFRHMYLFLRGSTATRFKHVSIGASEKTGSALWRDGSTVTWFNWADNEPSSPTEQCVNMGWFFYFKWNDVPCSSGGASAQYNFICQKDI
uniref:C-type lectin n=1 Tax=Littorina littorea TaxID=31216 RepID=A0A0A7RPW5_LITLI|nr:C-type lectin [Littorina littorea]